MCLEQCLEHGKCFVSDTIIYYHHQQHHCVYQYLINPVREEDEALLWPFYRWSLKDAK